MIFTMTKINKQLFFSIVIMALVLAPMLGCAPLGTQPSSQATPVAPVTTATTIHLKVGVLDYLVFSPIFIAKDKGYFAAQGLDVELVNFGSTGGNMVPALLQRQLDVGTLALSSSLLNAIAQGADIKIVGENGYLNPASSCPTIAWVESKALLDSGRLKTPSDLKGKKVIAFTGNIFEFALDRLLKENGLSQTDVQLVNIQDNPTRLQGLGNGSIDLAPLGEPWITRAQAAGAGDIWMPLSRVIPDYPSGVFEFGPTILNDNPDAGVRFMVAYLKALQEYDRGKTEDNLAIIAKYTKLTPQEVKNVCWDSYRADGKIDPQILTDFAQWTVEKGYVDTPLSIDKIWDPQFVDQANKLVNK